MFNKFKSLCLLTIHRFKMSSAQMIMNKETEINYPMKDIPTEDLPNIMFRMKNNFPDAIHAHEYLRVLVEWKKKKPDIIVKFLAPNGDYNKGILFFNVFGSEVNGSIYCHDDNEIIVMREALTTYLPELASIYNNHVILFTCLNTNMHEITKSFRGEWEMKFDDSVFWLPWNCAKELEVHLPPGVEIRMLTKENADQINDVWPFKSNTSRDLIIENIELNFGMGIFREDKLLSWAIYWFYGGLGAVQTEINEKRKGYGRAVVEAITKELGERQIDVHLNVVNGNTVGESFFKEIGFKFAFKAVWIYKCTYNSKIENI